MNENCWMKKQCNQRDCNTFCLKFFKVNVLYNESLIPISSRKHLALRTDVDGTDEDIFEQLSKIENNVVDFISSGQSMYLWSTNTGNSKTSWALRLVESYFNKIWFKSELKCRVLFISVPRFLLELKNFKDPTEYIQHINDNVMNCDLVIWDDIATKTVTTFEAEHLFTIIDYRINCGKSNIYTSNLNGADLCKALGDRLYSRIVNKSKYVFEFRGKDKRGLGGE